VLEPPRVRLALRNCAIESAPVSTARECLIPTVHLAQSCFKLEKSTYNGIIPEASGLTSFGLSRTITLLMLLTSHSPSSRQRCRSIRGRSDADGYTTAAVPKTLINISIQSHLETFSSLRCGECIQMQVGQWRGDHDSGSCGLQNLVTYA
jgi:hypothetical protein